MARFDRKIPPVQIIPSWEIVRSKNIGIAKTKGGGIEIDGS
jgi:hypothetical protein